MRRTARATAAITRPNGDPDQDVSRRPPVLTAGVLRPANGLRIRRRAAGGGADGRRRARLAPQPAVPLRSPAPRVSSKNWRTSST